MNNNVIFASTLFSTCFSTLSFANLYSAQSPSNMNPLQFQKFLWGDIFYNEQTRKFERKAGEQGWKRSFIHFILEPFYKIISCSISNEKQELQPILKKLGVYLKKKDFLLDIKPLLKLVMGKLFGDVGCLVDAMVENFKNAVDGTRVKV